MAYRDRVVLREISFTLPAGSLTAVVGPNGAGKSTLLKASLGLVPTRRGGFTFFGGTYERGRRRVSYVPQRTSIDWDFPVTAHDVVCMGLYGQIGWLRRVRRTHREAALGAMRTMGIESVAARQISQLSGGQQQRVFLARALVQQADLYLMDEPLAGVDASTERVIIETLHRLRADGKSALVVHHDLQTVGDYFDRVLLINETLVASGPAVEVMTAAHLRTAYGGRLLVIERSGHAGGSGDEGNDAEGSDMESRDAAATPRQEE